MLQPKQYKNWKLHCEGLGVLGETVQVSGDSSRVALVNELFLLLPKRLRPQSVQLVSGAGGFCLYFLEEYVEEQVLRLSKGGTLLPASLLSCFSWTAAESFASASDIVLCRHTVELSPLLQKLSEKYKSMYLNSARGFEQLLSEDPDLFSSSLK